MIVALILLAAIVGVGCILYAEQRHYLHRKKKQAEAAGEAPAEDTATATAGDDSECCGMHITCEKDSLLASVSSEIVYYDDEELDRFAGKDPASYSDEEIEEFRDVLITMKPDDIAGWGRSLQLRNIPIPQPVRDELIMIVAEARHDAGIS